MKLRLLMLALPVVLATVACAESVGAVDPAGSDVIEPASNQRVATTQPATVTGSITNPPLARPQPTATRVVSPVRPVPTRTDASVAPVPVATSVPRPVFNAPAPRPTSTRIPVATRVPFDPNATPTPLWILPPKIVPTSTSTPIPLATAFIPPTVVAAAPQDQFQPVLNYRYSLPAGWSEVKTESSLILYDRSGKISITISEQVIEPWRYPTVIALGIQTFPARPDGWDTWNLLNRQSIQSGNVYEFQFDGAKQTTDYLNFVQWYMWGDLQIQVSAEVPQFDWEASATVRTELQDLLESFKPHDGSKQFTESQVLELLGQRLDDRPSGIYARDEVVRARYELTCRDIFTDLLQTPQYFGDGLWQMTAQTLLSTESWRVFEPTGSVVALNSNLSVC